MKRAKPHRAADRAQLNEVRRSLVKQWLEEAAARTELGAPLCEIAWDRRCHGVATHAHEPLTRARGGSIIDRANVLLTCFHCHNAVHANPAEATSRGYLRNSWDAQPDGV